MQRCSLRKEDVCKDMEEQGRGMWGWGGLAGLAHLNSKGLWVPSL